MSTTYSTPGTYSYQVPAGVTSLAIDIASAQGGTYTYTYSGGGSVAGGKGGRVQCAVPVTPGETLTLIVGAQGSTASNGPNSSSQAGGSGGATGGASNGCSGGGTTELRRGSTRLVVAGAGGGATATAFSTYPGGAGAGVGTGANGQRYAGTAAQGGTSTAGGDGGQGATNGGNGTSSSGGAGASTSTQGAGGGGGGGYFGGGGGNIQGTGSGATNDPYTFGCGSGAGGSGYADSSATSVTGTNGYQSGNGYFTVVETPPNAPTPTSPSGNPTVNRLQPFMFAATFSDPDAGDAPSRFWMRYRSTTASPTPAWTVVSQTGTSQQYTTAGSYFAADHYEFQFAYQDAQGVPSDTSALAWSASTFAFFATPSNAPTITSPTNGASIGTASYTVRISQPTLDQFRYYVTDTAGNSLVALTTVTDATQVAARQFTISNLVNNTGIKIYVATHDTNGWTSYAESDNTVSYTPPRVTSATLTGQNDPPTLTTGFATAAASSTVSATTSVLVEYSRDDGATVEHDSVVEAPNGTDVFLTPAGDLRGSIVYCVRVTARAGNGTVASTGWLVDVPVVDADDLDRLAVVEAGETRPPVDRALYDETTTPTDARTGDYWIH